MASLIDKYTKEELADIVAKSHSLRDVIKAVGYSCFSGSNNDTVRKRIENYGISTQHFTHLPPTDRNFDNVFCENSTASQRTLRKWYEKEFGVSFCEICGQSNEWNHKSLTMILDHKNGKKLDNRPENLRWICPNCDSQLDTFAGRNRVIHNIGMLPSGKA